MANNFKNAFATSVSTNSSSPTTVYTANNGSTAVNSILIELDVANTGNSGVTVSVIIYDNSGTASFHIVKNATIGAGSTITQDAPDDKLTLSRNKQSTMSKWKRPQKK